MILSCSSRCGEDVYEFYAEGLQQSNRLGSQCASSVTRSIDGRSLTLCATEVQLWVDVDGEVAISRNGTIVGTR